MLLFRYKGEGCLCWNNTSALLSGAENLCTIIRISAYFQGLGTSGQHLFPDATAASSGGDLTYPSTYYYSGFLQGQIKVLRLSLLKENAGAYFQPGAGSPYISVTVQKRLMLTGGSLVARSAELNASSNTARCRADLQYLTPSINYWW